MDRTISVIIPTHYRNDLFPEVIEGVAEQEYEPIELIVVDDSGERHAEPVLSECDDIVDQPIVRDENGGGRRRTRQASKPRRASICSSSTTASSRGS